MTERIRRVVAGQPPSAAHQNQIADAVDELHDLRQLAGVPDPRAATESQLMVVTAIAGAALLGIPGTVPPAGGEVPETIRLPPTLIEAARGGVTITIIDANNATATDGTTNETWELIKPYAVNDVIECFRWSQDGVWTDRNIAGRMWAALPVIGGGGGASP